MDSSNPDPSAVDSAANHMDSTGMDLLEVPDTPDRLAVMRPTEGVGEDAPEETYHQTRSNAGLRFEKTSSSNAFVNERIFRRARLASLVSKPFDVELYHDKKKLSFGISYPTRHRSDRRKIKQDLHGVNEAGCSDQLKSMVPSSSGQIRGTHNRIANSMELSDDAYGAEGNQGMNDIVITGALPGHCSTSGVVESNCVGNGISLASDSQAKTEETTSKPHPRRFGRRRLVRNGLISPSNVKGKLSLASEESHASFSGISSFYKGKGIDLSGDSQNKSEHTLLHQCQFDAPWKNSDQGMLVRNGFISPLNMGESRNAAHCEWDGFERVDTGEVQDGILSPQLHVTADSVSRQAHEIKENIFLNDIVQTNGQDDAKSSFMSSRELLLPCKETIIGGKDIADVRPADDNGFREMHRRAGRSVQPLSQGSSSNQKHDSMLHSVCETDSLEVACPSPFTQKSTSHQFQRSFEVKFEHNPDNGSHSGEKRLARGKRKTGYNHKLIGECSSSACIGPDGLRPEIPGETSTAKSTRGHILQSHAIITEPIIDADELPSLVFKSASHCNISCLSSESVARAQQVESDEILARRLQEHFSNELSNFGGSEEIDATIAWTLQEEEDAQLASSIRNRGQSHPRSPSIAHLYRQYPRQSSQDSSTQSASRARITPSARMTRLQRNVRRDLDLET
ncbi:hypothetical protein Taro_005459, partial [Colocasia esculenta]|nr:hypothetical protein [Colocasia esculenta]